MLAIQWVAARQLPDVHRAIAAGIQQGVKIYTLACHLLAPVPLEQAFDVFQNPYNLARITPPWLNFRILTPDLRMEPGVEIDYEFRWCGLPLKWKTRITEYQPPFLFVDEAIRSPYSHWRHEHRFLKTPEGTLISDRVDYVLPLGFLGAAMHDLLVAKQLRSIFQYRQKAILDILGSPAAVKHGPVIVAGSTADGSRP